MRAVAYYRIRPSEPDASSMALRLQQEAVRTEVEESRLTLVAEFTEREGEAGSETYPAYTAAVRAAAYADDEGGNKLGDEPVTFSAMLLIATNAAIGTGAPFHEPVVTDVGANRIMYACLNAPTVPLPREIALPVDAPRALCLHAINCPTQLETLVYLCNGGPDALSEIIVAIDTISDAQFYASARQDRWTTVEYTREQNWDTLPSGVCTLVGVLPHTMYDAINRYCFAFSDLAGRRWTMEADDHALRGCGMAGERDRIWHALYPIQSEGEVSEPLTPMLPGNGV